MPVLSEKAALQFLSLVPLRFFTEQKRASKETMLLPGPAGDFCAASLFTPPPSPHPDTLLPPESLPERRYTLPYILLLLSAS